MRARGAQFLECWIEQNVRVVAFPQKHADGRTIWPGVAAQMLLRTREWSRPRIFVRFAGYLTAPQLAGRVLGTQVIKTSAVFGFPWTGCPENPSNAAGLTAD